MKSLEGKSAIVVGGGRGIGAATARLLASEGASVTIADLHADLAEGTAQAICSDHGCAIHVPVDVGEEGQVAAMVEKVHRTFGKIDVLLNNAAPTHLLPEDGAVTEIDASVWDAIFAGIARGTFLTCKHVIPHMQQSGGGSIINTSSMAGQRGTWICHAYGSAKAAIDNLTRCIAARYGVDRIRCNAIAPGLITHVGAGEQPDLDPEFRRQWLNAMLVPRIGVDFDIARMVLFLAQDAADYVTGQIIAVDGGALAWAPWGRIADGGIPKGATG